MDEQVLRGIEGCQVTSVTRELGAEQDVGALGAIVARRFGDVYDREPVEVDAGALAAAVEGLEALAATQAAGQALSSTQAPLSSW